jgi:transposase
LGQDHFPPSFNFPRYRRRAQAAFAKPPRCRSSTRSGRIRSVRNNRAAIRNERQEGWFAGVEGAFRHFGGVTKEVLLDNDRGLVARHDDRVTREVEFNARLHSFAKHWGFRPRACAPFRARTKGKDERGVGYVKKNAIAGRHFERSPTLEAQLDGWVRDVADQRVHNG